MKKQIYLTMMLFVVSIAMASAQLQRPTYHGQNKQEATKNVQKFKLASDQAASKPAVASIGKEITKKDGSKRIFLTKAEFATLSKSKQTKVLALPNEFEVEK